MSEQSTIPLDVQQSAEEVVSGLLPTKSREVYECAYKRFIQWAKEKNVHEYSENVLLAYFVHLSSKMKSSTLWSQYSMIRTTLNLRHGINIQTYCKLRAFLKRKSEVHTPKKAKVFTKDQMDQFLLNAPDNQYLMMKVVLIFGVAGACRCDELTKLKIDDVEDVKSALLVKIPNSKTNKARSFTILGNLYLEIYRKYFALRPTNYNERPLFLRYQSGRCHRIVVGIHKISNVSQEVARFLQLTNPNQYTGHSLRRTSATLLVDSGGDLTCLKRHGGWKSNTVAEGYIEESFENKKDIAKKNLQVDEATVSNTSTSDEPVVANTSPSFPFNSAGDMLPQTSTDLNSDFANEIFTTDIVNSTKNVNSLNKTGLLNLYGNLYV